jgi:release factor glutamine methyltransferase
MLTVLEAIQKSTDYLEKKGIESSRLNAELLLAEILNCKRLDLYLRFERPLSEEEINKYREWIARRGKYEPLQYIIGKVEFYGLNFIVNNSVLIPRPETEILVETIVEQNKQRECLRILDIGTGSGIIPIALAKHLAGASVTTVDISSSALETAKLNAEANGVGDAITFIERDIFNMEYENATFDLIVSNPPYVSKEEYSLLQKEIVDYEPTLAVSDNEDGLKFYRFIIEKGKSWLAIGGKLYFEVGKDQSEKANEMMERKGYQNISVVKDYQQIERVIKGEKH